MNILRSLFDFEYKELRRFMKIADQIEAKSDEYEKLTDKQLQHKTEEFKKELEKGKTLDDILGITNENEVLKLKEKNDE